MFYLSSWYIVLNIKIQCWAFSDPESNPNISLTGQAIGVLKIYAEHSLCLCWHMGSSRGHCQNDDVNDLRAGLGEEESGLSHWIHVRSDWGHGRFGWGLLMVFLVISFYNQGLTNPVPLTANLYRPHCGFPNEKDSFV